MWALWLYIELIQTALPSHILLQQLKYFNIAGHFSTITVEVTIEIR
jgi:hypothetical protein